MVRNATAVEPYGLRTARRRSELAAGLERFIAAAKSFDDISAVYVYGSFARIDVGPRSDLDILIVRQTVLRERPAFAPGPVSRDARAASRPSEMPKNSRAASRGVSIVARRAPNASLIPTKRREVYRK
jgi:predicted nucleotidyltransferase